MGACKTGLTACVNGATVCNGSVTATAEVCNLKDDNCNGVTDESLTDPWIGTACCPTGNNADCTNSGAGTRCKTGAYACTAGAQTCNGGIAKSVEISTASTTTATASSTTCRA